MSIDELYRFVQFMANKEQRGFIKPTEFNMLAERAQLDVIRDRCAKIGAQGAPSTPMTHSVMDDLASLVEHSTITYSSDGDGAFPYPGDYLYFLRITLGGHNVEIITHDQLGARLKSEIAPPSTEYPIGVMIEEGFELYSNTSEDTSGTCVVTYIEKPNAPFWGYVVINDQYVYSSTMNDTVQLSLPESTHNEIASRILSYIGISLRDQEILQYAEAKTGEHKQ